MTDLENLQKQENQMEDDEERRQNSIQTEILALFVQLSPQHQIDLLESLAEDEDLDDEDDDA